MTQENRSFTGIWIPATLWLNEDLEIIEKVMLIEIESLDKDFGCVASNAYFAGFFKRKPNRISQIIKKLFDLGYLNISYSNDNKRTITLTKKCNSLGIGLGKINKKNVHSKNIKTEKVLSVNDETYSVNDETYSVNDETYSVNDETYSVNDETYSVNDVTNRDTFITTSNNTLKEITNEQNLVLSKKQEIEKQFNELWIAYKLKIGRASALKAFEKAIKHTDLQTLIESAKNYDLHLESTKSENFKKHLSTWLNGKHWEDEYTTSETKQHRQSKFQMDYDF
jgi:hypothetical protein